MDTMPPAPILTQNKMTTKKQSWKSDTGVFASIKDYASPCWVGDIDFYFTNKHRVIIGEIKTVKDKYFSPKQNPLYFEQAEIYASMVGLVNNNGCEHEVYLMEEHIFSDEFKNNNPEKKWDDYVVIVPFKKPTGDEKETIDFLDKDQAVCLFMGGKCSNGFNQITNWFSGLKIGKKTDYPLMCLG